MWSEIPVPVLVIYGSLLLKNGSAGSSGLHQQCLEDRESRVAFHSLWGRRRVWESALGSAGNRPGTSHPAWSHLLNVWKHRIIEHGFHGLTKHQKNDQTDQTDQTAVGLHIPMISCGSSYPLQVGFQPRDQTWSRSSWKRCHSCRSMSVHPPISWAMILRIQTRRQRSPSVQTCANYTHKRQILRWFECRGGKSRQQIMFNRSDGGHWLALPSFKNWHCWYSPCWSNSIVLYILKGAQQHTFTLHIPSFTFIIHRYLPYVFCNFPFFTIMYSSVSLICHQFVHHLSHSFPAESHSQDTPFLSFFTAEPSKDWWLKS